ncbi:MAG: ABC transporter ATP-binding protein [Anaeromicrobium sp.]|jgi:ABC-2 type transport system ATP-binding protein|uniref:ABC transporter ATP-binding protein n=1 Tax=Anaeromicrobium sp. TaxID=1929132 RepID=UPI0025DC7082|nr:ABC transporter ATP-binding protein [Anaeromicrobium sp.]MCT4593643.1 ABC transporter ATP-binding protein [Anaeromicrobium sp.]
MLRVHNLTKYLGEEKILDGVNLTVKKGSIYGLVGPNGAGKSTLIKNIVGIYNPEEGNVYIEGNTVSDPLVRNDLAYVPDYQNFYPNFKVKDMVEFYKNTYSNWDEDKFNRLRDMFELDMNKKIRKLSKGQKTQLSIHLNLSTNPKLLIMDEPTSGLDPVIRKEVLNLMVDEAASNDCTVLVSTHNLGELEQICDTIGFISKGKVNLETNLEDLKENIKKVQVAFKNKLPEPIENDSTILKIEKLGRVYHIVVKEHVDDFIKKLHPYDPILVETMDMSLEEIFIYKMAGEGYEFKKII